MSYVFSRALVEAYSEENSLDGGQSAPLKMIPTPQAYLSPDRMTDFSLLSRFGMTFAPLTADHGEALLMWYLEDFHVRISAQQEKAQESPAKNPDSGWKWRESLVRYDPDTRLWKTRQFSLLEDSEWFSETWPRWGFVFPGVSLEPLTLERHTKETEYGLSGSQSHEQDASIHKAFATTTLSAMWAEDGKTAVLKWEAGRLGTVYEAEVLLKEMPERITHKDHSHGKSISFSSKTLSGKLLRAMRITKEFAGTSQEQDFIRQHQAEFADALRELSQHIALAGAEGEWIVNLEWNASELPMSERPTKGIGYGLLPTHVASDPIQAKRLGGAVEIYQDKTGKPRRRMKSGRSASMGLGKMVAQGKWPTPTASMMTAGDMEQSRFAGSDRRRPSYAEANQMWPTPTVCGNHNRKGASANSGDGLATAVKMWPTPRSKIKSGGGIGLDGGTGSREMILSNHGEQALKEATGGSLNPTWVEWLMGFPLGWTDLKPLETDRSHNAPRKLGEY